MIANESRDHVSADPYGPECPAVTSRAKRAMDVVVAGIALTALGPLMLLIGAAVRLTSRGPALFRQERVGLRGEPFTMLKFRSMVVDNDDSAHRELCTRQLLGDEDSAAEDGVFKLDDDPRVTAVGRWLRRLSLDELPQLINVLRGDMSIVGPRPALQWEVDLYPPRHLRRLAVRPGITGLWQVSGRNRLSMLEMLDLDVRYVDDWSLWGDIMILLATPAALLRGDGAR
ncbi:MAG TPA: sugar transferase [Acidimicrobiia bacterium]|mgnify:CR=1 FL=1|nr:sugar transferase [Acidimicrobiia bacterium]